MTIHAAKIPVREGQVVTFDGEVHTVVGRVDGPNHGDTFVVEHDGETTERHIDWFADEASKADRIVIERDTLDWRFDVGDVIQERAEHLPSFEGTGKIGGDTQYEIRHRYLDADKGGGFYFVEYEDGDQTKHTVKARSYVDDLYDLVEEEEGGADDGE